MIKSGDVLFLEYGCYRKVKVKIAKAEDHEYLRVDCQIDPWYYFG